jgi:FixJ family two-component response regulator
VADTNIAVIDDEAMVRIATASLLRAKGYHAVPFASASDFLVEDESAFDCVLSDFQMPGMSGVELHRVLRNSGKSVPMVLMTAYPTPMLGDYVAESDIIALLEKPIESENLIVAVEQALAS